jgi:hypothetical protein
MYDIFINKVLYSVKSGFITGTEIKKLGSIPLGHLLKFQLSKAMDFIEINDNDHIDLTRAGAECFLSEKR